MKKTTQSNQSKSRAAQNKYSEKPKDKEAAKLRRELLDEHEQELEDISMYEAARVHFINQYIQYLEFYLTVESLNARQDADIIKLYTELLNTRNTMMIPYR